MRKILFIMLVLLSLTSCKRDHLVGLYKDKIEKDNILAIFPVFDLDQALTNCESTVELYKEDDQKNNIASVTTGVKPIYYCREIECIFCNYQF